MPPDEAAAAATAPDTAAAATTAASPASSPDADFSNLGSADDLDLHDEIEVIAEPAETPDAEKAASGSTEEGASPKTPPTSSEAPKPPLAEAKPQTEQTPPAATPPVAQPSPAPGEADSRAAASPQGLAEQLAQHSVEVIQQIAQDRFRLSDAELSELETDAATAVPKLLAKTYHQAMVSTLLHIQNQVPKLVTQVLEQQKAQDAVEQKFYGSFPALDRSKHHRDALAFANVLRQTSPQITQDDLFAMVGAAVMAKHGLHGVPASATNGAVRPTQPAPFVPARPGTSVKVTQEPESPFAGLGKDFDD
jgi:hypothetical protein